MSRACKRSRDPERAILMRGKGVTTEMLQAKVFRKSEADISRTTRLNYQRMETSWIAFCIELQLAEDEDASLLRLRQQLPCIQDVKRFLMWFVASSKGQLRSEEGITINSAISCWQQLSGMFRNRCGQSYDKATFEDVRSFIRTELREMLNMPDVVKSKEQVDGADLPVLLAQLLIIDREGHVSGRGKVSAAFSTQLHFFSAARPGAVFRNAVYPEFFLKYKDVDAIRYREKDGRLRWALKVRQENMKGKKGKAGAFLDVVMREQRGSFCTCPVTFFLATVLADDALEQSLTPEQVVSFAVPIEGSGFARLRWKKEKLEEPIFRDGNGAPVSYRLWLDQLSELGRRAGYVKGITPYHIRRGVANALDERGISAAQRRQLLGHDDDQVYERSYQSGVSSVDVQRLILSTADDEEFDIKVFREVQRIPIVARLTLNERRNLDIAEAEVESSASPGSRRKAKRRRIMAIQQQSSLSLASSSPSAPGHPPSEKTRIPNSIERLGDLRQPTTMAALLRRYDKHVNTIHTAFDDPKYELTAPILHSLVHMCRQDRRAVPETYYPGEAPKLECVNGKELKSCEHCQLDLTSHSSRSCINHIHRCASRKGPSSRASRRQSTLPYCHRCNIWLPDKTSFRKHQDDHLHEADFYCGILRIRRFLIASPGRCPFCMSSSSKEAPALVEFARPKLFLQHLQDHLRAFSYGYCPHPRCGRGRLFSREQLIHHLYDEHGIQCIAGLADWEGEECLDSEDASSAIRCCEDSDLDETLEPCSTTPIESTRPASRAEVEAFPMLRDTSTTNVDRHDSLMIDIPRSDSTSPTLESKIDVPRAGWFQYLTASELSQVAEDPVLRRLVEEMGEPDSSVIDEEKEALFATVRALL